MLSFLRLPCFSLFIFIAAGCFQNPSNNGGVEVGNGFDRYALRAGDLDPTYDEDGYSEPIDWKGHVGLALSEQKSGKALMLSTTREGYKMFRAQPDGGVDPTMGFLIDDPSISVWTGILKNPQDQFFLLGVTSFVGLNRANHLWIQKYSQDGVRDLSFSEGKNRIELPGAEKVAIKTIQGATLLSDGRILISLSFYADYRLGLMDNDPHLVLLKTDGSLDASFGNAGLKRIFIPDSGLRTSFSFVAEAAGPGSGIHGLFQFTEKVPTAGAIVNQRRSEFFVLDLRGNVTQTTRLDFLQEPTRMIAQPSLQGPNKLLLYPAHTLGQSSKMRRISLDGKLDVTFGDSGVASFDITREGAEEFVSDSVNIDASGRIVIAGHVADFAIRALFNGYAFQTILNWFMIYGQSTKTEKIYIARLLRDGKPDPDFANKGVGVYSLPVESSKIHYTLGSTVIQKDQKILSVANRFDLDTLQSETPDVKPVMMRVLGEGIPLDIDGPAGLVNPSDRTGG